MKPLHRCLVFAPLLAAGCSSLSPAARRAEHADSWSSNLVAETQAVLEKYSPSLSLADCRAIARERSLLLAGARLAERLARIDSQAAFSAYLPQVSAQFEAVNLSEPALRRMGESPVETQDQDIRLASIRIAQPVFTPNAWLLYASARRGADIRTLSRERAEQLVDVQVSSLFFQLAALESRRAAARRQAEAADALRKEVAALAREGYARDADLQQVRALEMNARLRAAQRDREAGLARSRLLEALNLWPLADASFRADSIDDPALRRIAAGPPDGKPTVLDPEAVEARPVEEWLFIALRHRLELYAGDQAVALRQNEILRALALFLPNLYGFANFYTTSDSYTINDQYWGAGLQGAWSLFTGFRNIQAYRAARAQRRQSFVEREEAALSVLLQVIEARKVVRDADEQWRVAKQNARAARQERSDARAQYESGYENLSRYLDALAADEAAGATLESAGFARSMAVQVFRDVIGMNKDSEHEQE